MNQSNDPRSIRARKLLQEALFILLQKKDFEKITVKDIVEEAGLSRPTFYNHYETKEHFLHELVSNILDKYFLNLPSYDLLLNDLEGEKSVGVSFFKIWQENLSFLELLPRMDLNQLLIERFTKYFQNFYSERGLEFEIGLSKELAKYIIKFNAYTLVSFLHTWIEDDMKYSDEVMGALLFHFIHPSLKTSAIEKFGAHFDS